MAYDQSKLIKDVRMFLGGVSEDKLPDNVIVYWGDFFDADPKYTGNYPFILWKTTLCTIQYLKAAIVTSVTATKSTTKEKVGDVAIDVTNDYGSPEEAMNSYDELYNDYSAHPEKFGIDTAGSSIVIINGVDAQEVSDIRTNTNTTSIYNPLPVTAFPKVTGIGEKRGRRLF